MMSWSAGATCPSASSLDASTTHELLPARLPGTPLDRQSPRRRVSFLGAVEYLPGAAREYLAWRIAIYSFIILNASLYVGGYALEFFGSRSPCSGRALCTSATPARHAAGQASASSSSMASVYLPSAAALSHLAR
jgi:hypothetical protein